MEHRLIFADEAHQLLLNGLNMDAVPTAKDAIVLKRGIWVTDRIAFMKTCSLCDESVDFTHNYNYCPNCGAKMNLEE